MTRLSESGPGGFEAGSGFGVGFVRGVLLIFALFFVLVLSSVPGMGRPSLVVSQLHKLITAATTTSPT